MQLAALIAQWIGIGLLFYFGMHWRGRPPRSRPLALLGAFLMVASGVLMISLVAARG